MSALGNTVGTTGPLTAAPQGIVELFFQPAPGQLHSSLAGASSPQGRHPQGKAEMGDRGDHGQAARQLQAAVQRIENSRRQRAKANAVWRDDPRRLQQLKDW